MRNPEELLVQKEQDKDAEPRFDPWKARIWRKVRQMTLQQLAEACGYGPKMGRMLSQVERYVEYVGPVTLMRLTTALGVSDADLMSDGPEFRANRVKYDAWVADGRPPLAKWLAEGK